MTLSRNGLGGQLLVAAILITPLLPAHAGSPPPFYEPRRILHESYPQMPVFAREAKPVIAEANAALAAAERQGRGVSCARQILVELRWRLNATSDLAAARDALARLKAALADIASPHSRDANVLPQDAEGSYGACDKEWFLKLADSGDELLDPGGWRGRLPPRFLDRVNTPAALIAYLETIIISDPAKEGIDRRKELNAATGVLSRLVLRGGVAGYLAGPEFRPVFRAFLDIWQDPATGFFGEWYIDHGRIIKTADLSVTFHMARYTKGRIGHWPELIDTLLAIKDRPYPQGWLDMDGMTNHNNYDVAMLFGLGWPQMREDQRLAARAEITRMLDWALIRSIGPDGEIAPTNAAEPLGDMYYFATAFLDTIGYFDKRKRFWTDQDFPEAERLRLALDAKARLLAPDAPFAQAILTRLSVPQPHENVTVTARPSAVTSLRVSQPLLMSGFMDARPLIAHDDATRHADGVDSPHLEEPIP